MKPAAEATHPLGHSEQAESFVLRRIEPRTIVLHRNGKPVCVTLDYDVNLLSAGMLHSDDHGLGRARRATTVPFLGKQ